jgi:hypothetical protein
MSLRRAHDPLDQTEMQRRCALVVLKGFEEESQAAAPAPADWLRGRAGNYRRRGHRGGWEPAVKPKSWNQPRGGWHVPKGEI